MINDKRFALLEQTGKGSLLLFFTLNREDFSFVIHLDRQPRTSRRREAQTGSRARSGSRSERTLDAVEHSRTLMEWWPFLIFHRGGLRIKVINNTCTSSGRPFSRARRDRRPAAALEMSPNHLRTPSRGSSSRQARSSCFMRQSRDSLGCVRRGRAGASFGRGSAKLLIG